MRRYIIYTNVGVTTSTSSNNNIYIYSDTLTLAWITAMYKN
ncbi:hypothetical protein SAMN06265171_102161 [Chryseobacterium rhizoplanae]|uniref:Uncharacterized protein n=1 Tax=Chryseobacterium rhizoplanae TaxID=1609531 RepID=A0A521BVA5_9FLAO|nr:hypothetical protein SAMN06265171_102161 [Chryseobacterium rhizoplanae]